MSYRACDPYNCSPTRSGRPTLSTPIPGTSGFFGNRKIAGRLGALSGLVAFALAGYAKREDIFGFVIKSDDGTIAPPPIDESWFRGQIKKPTEEEQLDNNFRRIFYSGNEQHFYHSLALMAVPYAAGRPALTGPLLVTGIICFCGTQYYRSLNHKEGSRPLLWIGGLCLISAWFTFLL